MWISLAAFQLVTSLVAGWWRWWAAPPLAGIAGIGGAVVYMRMEDFSQLAISEAYAFLGALFYWCLLPTVVAAGVGALMRFVRSFVEKEG